MDTQGNKDAEYVSYCLRTAKQEMKLADAGAALFILAAYSLVALTLVVVADHVRSGGLSPETRQLARWGYSAGALGLLAWLVLVPTARRISDLFAARAIERRHPEFRNSLISAIQLFRHRDLPGSMRAALAARAAGDLAVTGAWTAVDKRWIKRTALAALAASATFLMYGMLAPKPVWPSIRRALGVELPPPTRTQIVIEEPDPDLEVLVATPVRVIAVISGRRPEQAWVRFSLDGGATWLDDQQLALAPPPTTKTVDPKEQRRWRAVKPGRDVQQSLHYQVVAGDATSDIRLLRVRPYPEVAEVRIRCEPPAYTGLAATESQGGDVEAVVGTQVTASIKTTVPAESAPLLAFRKTKRGRLRTEAADETEMAFVGQFRVEADDEYSVDFRDRKGVRNRNPVVYKIQARPDAPPVVKLEAPEDGATLSANDSMELACEVSDDFGITQATLAFEIDARQGKIPLPLPKQERVKALQVRQAIPLSRLDVKPGDRVTWWVTAGDNRHNARGDLASQTTESEKRELRIRQEVSGKAGGATTAAATREGKTQEASPPPPSQAAKKKTAEPKPRTETSRPEKVDAPLTETTTSQRAERRIETDDELDEFIESHRRELAVLRQRLAQTDKQLQKTQATSSDRASQQDASGQAAPDENAQSSTPGGKTESGSLQGAKGQQGGAQPGVDRQSAEGQQQEAGQPSSEGGQAQKGQQTGKGQQQQAKPGPQPGGAQPSGQNEGSSTEDQSGQPQPQGSGKEQGQDEKTEADPKAGKGQQAGQGQQGPEGQEQQGQQQQQAQGERDSQSQPSGQDKQTGEDQQSSLKDEPETGQQSGEGKKSQGQEAGKARHPEGTQAGQDGQGQQPDQTDTNAQGQQPGESQQQGSSQQKGQGESQQGSQGQSSGKGEQGKGQQGQGEQGSEGQQGQGTEGKQSGQGQQPGESKGEGEGQGKGESSGQGKGQDGKGQAGKGESSGKSENSSSSTCKACGGKGCESCSKGKSESQSPGGKASADRTGGGGALDPTESGQATDDSTTTRPDLSGAEDLGSTSGNADDLAPTVDRADALVNELERQLRGQEPDPNLLDDLDWTPEQARSFVKEFKELKERSETQRRSRDVPQRVVRTPVREPGKDQWQEAKGRDAAVQGTSTLDRRGPDEINRLIEVRRQQVGPQYSALLEAYYKTVAGWRPSQPTTKPASAAP
ncbi:MAG: DUF4175 family protein [Phycisphaerae bacterium]|nr:DUF4175 family protein [Phycisphaerae bacterium]